MIPDFVTLPTAPWAVLPPGVHRSDLSAVGVRFANNSWRRGLFDGLLVSSQKLLIAGCRQLFLDGSFVTAKPIPGDFDACWDPNGVNPKLLDPVFLDFSNQRAAQKKQFGGEFFPSSTLADSNGRTFVEFFQVEKFTGLKKGIIQIDLTKDSKLQAQVAP